MTCCHRSSATPSAACNTFKSSRLVGIINLQSLISSLQFSNLQSPSGGAAVVVAKVMLGIQLVERQYGTVDADQHVVQGALATDSEAALHVAFHAQLAMPAIGAAQVVQRDEHWLG